jgi:putative transposase
MSAHQDISLPLLPDSYYHIFNRGNEKRRIYFEKDNYIYFLKKYAEYTSGYFDTYTYCLLDNHFHLLVKPKSRDEILAAALKDFEHVDSMFFNRYVIAWLRSIGMVQQDLTVLKTDYTSLKELLNLMHLHPYQPLPTTNPYEHPTHLEHLDFKTQLCSYLVSERFRRFMLSYAKSINKQQNRTGSLLQKPFRRKHIALQSDLKKVATYIHHNVIHHDYAHFFEAYPWSSYPTLISDQETRLAKDELLGWFGGLNEFISYSEQYKKHKWEQELFYMEET